MKRDRGEGGRGWYFNRKCHITRTCITNNLALEVDFLRTILTLKGSKLASLFISLVSMSGFSAFSTKSLSKTLHWFCCAQPLIYSREKKKHSRDITWAAWAVGRETTCPHTARGKVPIQVYHGRTTEIKLEKNKWIEWIKTHWKKRKKKIQDIKCYQIDVE